MCDCFHLAFPNWHAASSGMRPGRRLQGPEAPTEDSICDEPSQFTESERPRPQGSSPVEEYPETEKYSDSDKECDREHDPHHKSGTRKKTKKSGLGSMFEKRSTPKMSKLKEVDSPESGLIVKTAKEGCAEGLIYGGGGKEGIFIKKVVPESPASKSLKLKEGDQILSATVYFDNMSYEDAIQILEHAQAYKLKLCLKRKPEMTEPEPATESHAIPEEDLYIPEMREQGKTKRRGEARISWPKFSSFGKGRKSRFIRSHSSSEADEQRKLELSPTTSDTESPIKTQDALKYKKKHKMKLAGLTKRGRISSSEDQDTDVPTTGQISSSIHQTQESDMLSPECLESPLREMPEVYVTEDLKVVKDLQFEESNQTFTETLPTQHKVELISIDSTLKTADLTVALTDQESPSGIKSPDGKKKKKERSELKMKILGKDKSHKKEAKAKSSPKRLKTLGASFELVDHPEMEKSDLIPSFESHTKPAEEPALDAKVEHDVSGVTVSQKYPQISEAERQKGSEIKEKQETKKGQTFKLPKVCLGEVTTEEIRHDPYEKLAKSSDFRTQLPKREDIEIPGMEAASMKTTAKRKKEPKASYTGHNGDFQAETVQLSIDVDSVKEAVSKLPGYKLPKVDTSGMPIPEEITVIDANAQRISVKTPTKVVDTKTKHGVNLAKFDATSPEIAKTTVKPPQFTTGQSTSEDLLTESTVDIKKPEKEHETKQKQGSKEMKSETHKREDIIIPGKESLQETSNFQVHEADKTQGTGGIKFEYESDKKSKKAKMTMPSIGIAKPDIRIHDIGIDLPKQIIFQQKGDVAKGEKAKFHQEGKMSKTEMEKCKGKTEGVVCEVMIPEIDGIEYIDSVDSSPAKKDDRMIRHTGSLQETRSEIKKAETEEHTVKLLQFGATTAEISVKAISTDGAETKTLEREGKGNKFKMPNLGISIPKVKAPKTDSSPSKKEVTVTLPVAKAEFQLPEAAETDVTLGSVDIYIPMDKEKHDMEIKHSETEGEFDRQGGKFKMPKLGIAIPKVKGPEVDFSLSQKNEDVKPRSETKMKIKPSDAEEKQPFVNMEITAPEIKVVEKNAEETQSKFKMPTFKLPRFGSALPNTSAELYDKNLKDTEIPETQLKSTEGADIPSPNTDIVGSSFDAKTTPAEVEGKGSKFKMPNLGFSKSKVKGPKIDVSLTKKDIGVTLHEGNASVKLPKVDLGEREVSPPDAKITDVKIPETAVEERLQEAHKIAAEVKTPEYEADIARHGGKFKMSTFGVKMTKTDIDVQLLEKKTDVKLPEVDLGTEQSLSKKYVDVTPQTEIETKLTDTHEIDVRLWKAEVLIPQERAEDEIEVHGSKFTLPKFGITMPKVKGPEFNIRLSNKDVNITTPEAEISHPDVELEATSLKAEIKATEIEVVAKDTKGSSSALKMPKIKGPDINLSMTKKEANVTLPVTEPEVTHLESFDINIGHRGTDILISDAKEEVKTPEVQVKPLQTIVDLEGQGAKFKMQDFGITIPKLKGPDIDFGFSKKDANMAQPEDEIPGTPKIAVDMKSPEYEAKIEGQGTKFKMPKLGITIAKVKGPDIDFKFSKKDVDVTLPEAKVEIKLPHDELEKASAEVEIEAPEIKGVTKNTGSSPTKFKMPAFKLPKFGVGATSAKAELSDMEKGIKIEGTKISIPEKIVEVNNEEPSIELKEPSVSLKTTGAEHEGKGSKFKLPSLGISVPKTKGPDMDLSLSKKDIDVTLPEAKAEVKLPDVKLEKPSAEVEIEADELKVEKKEKKGSPSKFTMPTFKLPKFGLGTTSVTAEVPDVDKRIKIEEADISVPEKVVEVNIDAPSIALKELSVSLKTTGAEHEGKGSKFKLPSLGISVPQTRGPDMDLSLSKKDVDVTLPEAKAEVTLPDVELEKPSAEVEIEAPGVKVEKKDKKGSPSKFKMPTFKLPKFGFGTTTVPAEVPDMDKNVRIEGADISIPKEVLEVNIEAPSIDLKEPSVSMKTTGAEHEGKGSKFKLPSLGISVPQTKGPDMDLSLSKKDVDVTLPEAKAEVRIPCAELEKRSAEVEIETREIKVVTKDKKGSPSKYKMPTFKLPKFGVSATSVAAEVPDVEKRIKIEEADISVPEKVVEVNIDAPSIELKEPSISLKTTGAEHDGKGSQFKLPGLGFSVHQTKGPDIDLNLSKKDIDVTLPEAKAEVKLPNVELEKPSAEVEIEAPEVKVEIKDKKGSPSKFTMPTFKLPKFGIGSPAVTAEVLDMDKGIKIEGADISIPEEVLEVNIEAPTFELKEPSVSLKTTEVEHEGKGSKFKLPSLGISVPQTKGPDIDLSLSNKYVDLTLPEAKLEVTLLDVELEKPSAEVEIEAAEVKVEKKDKKGSPSKFTMPTFKLPKFGIGTTSVTAEVPDVEKGIKIEGADISIPEKVVEVNIEAPRIELKESPVSLKTTGVQHEGKESKFKLPSLGISVPQTKGPDIDISFSKKDADVTLPEAKADVKLPDVELERPSAEVEIEVVEVKVEKKDKKGSPSKFTMPTFKLPKFGIGTTSVTVEVPDAEKGIKIEGADISIPEKVVEVSIEAPSIELKEPSVSLKTTGAEHEEKESKFNFPSLGISVPQTKGPDIDLSLSKKDVDVTLPKAKAEVKPPDVELEKPSAEVEIEAPGVKVEKKDKKGSPSKFKMPTFKLPKFGVGVTSVTAEVPDMDKGIKIEGADISIPEDALEVNIDAPSIELKESSVSLKTTGVGHEGKGSKFKLPSLGISVPKTKGPDIDLILSKKDVDVTLPEAKAEVKLPDVELEKPSAEVEIEAPEIKVELKDKKGSPSKFTMPTFKLPKFGIGTTSVTAEVPDVEKGIKIEGADISIPEKVVEVNIEAPSIELKEPSISLKTTGAQHEGKESKFKLPSLGISVPQTKGPDMDLSLSKKDADVTLPEAKAEVKLPDVELEKPSAEVEIEAPEVSFEIKEKKGSPSKFKMPTFKLPKFGVGVTSVTAEVPDVEKGIKIEGTDISIPEKVVEVNIEAPSIELKEPSVSLKTTGAEHEGKGSKFKLPSLGISVPQTKGPDIDLSLSKKDADVTLPEAKAKVKLPDAELEKPSAEVEIEAPEIKVEIKDKKGSPSKFTMPTFKLPKFGFGNASATAEVPDMDKGIKIEGADISIAEEVLEVNIEASSIELKEPSISLKTTGAEHEGKGSKFKLPSLGISVPQAKGPDINSSLSKKDADVTLTEAKAEVKPPDVELEKPSAEVEIEAPEIKVELKDKKGSPSKYKMPTFKLPKFGFGTTSVTAEVPNIDKGIKIEGADISIPEKVVEINIEAPSIELKEPSVSLKTTGAKHEGKGSKFKLPSLGIFVPQTKGPDIDLSLSKKDVDVTLPEAEAEVKLPDVELEKPSAEVEIEAPEISVETKDKKGSPSKFKMPTFKLPKFGIGSTSVTAEVSDMDKDVKIEGTEISIPEEVLKVNIEAPSIKLKEPSVSLKTTGAEHEGKESKFKLPSLGISVPQTKGPEMDLSLSKKAADVTLPKAKTEVKPPDAELERPSKVSMEVTEKDKETEGGPSIDSKGLSVEVKAKGGELAVSGSKFKMPNLGISMPKVKGPETDLSLSKKDVDVSLSESTAEVKQPHIEGKETEGGISVPEAPIIEAELKSKRPSWTFPKLSFSRTGDKVSDVDVNTETPKVDISTKAEVSLSDAEIKGPSMEQPPAAEIDTNLKKRKFSLPRFSFSKSNIKEPEISDELPHTQVSVPGGEVKVKHPGVEIKAPEQETEQGSTFKFPKFGIVQTKVKGPETDFNASKNNADIKFPEIKADVKISEDEVKQSSSETEAKSKDAGGSPLKIKIPPLKMPKFGSTSYDVTTEAPKPGKVIDTDGSKLKQDVSASEKDLSVKVKMDDSKGTILDSETPKIETDGEGHGSPSKFKLSSFKMPNLSFSRPKPEEEILPADTEDKKDQLEIEDESKGEGKSPKKILTSFGEILKTIDVEFDVLKADNVEENLVVSKEVQEIDEPTRKQLEAKEKEAITMQDTSKTPERTGWFKFPKFGLPSPSERDEQKDKKSPVGGTGDEEISPTCSVQSSDAFADISSTITSEHVDPPISLPTTVTVKYSDPNVASGLGETHSKIITSTTRAELISVEPNLAEKITILSSGISSSSEDTLRLDSGKIHVVTTNIQATPEAQHAKLLTDIEGELAGGLPLKSEAGGSASWTVEDSKSGNRTVFERHVVKKTSSERSESRETIVITKQITHVFDSPEPISGETASSIQRLRDSVHTEKMRFFDDAEK